MMNQQPELSKSGGYPPVLPRVGDTSVGLPGFEA